MNNRLANRKTAWMKIRKFLFDNMHHFKKKRLEIRQAIDVVDVQINNEFMSIHDLGRYEVVDKATDSELFVTRPSKDVIDFLNDNDIPLEQVKINWHPEACDE